MSLFGYFWVGTNSLRSFQVAMSAVGQNIANVNTPGYSRRRVDVAERVLAPGQFNQMGDGIQIEKLSRMKDRFLDFEMHREGGALGRFRSQAQALTGIESFFGELETPGLGTAISDLFDGFNALAATPEDLAARQETLAAADALAREFRLADRRIGDARIEADQRVKDTVNEVNALTTRIADLNRQISRVDPRFPEGLRAQDERDRLVTELSQLVEIHQGIDEDGSYSISLASTGDALVVDNDAFALSVRVDPTNDNLVSVGAKRAGGQTDVTARMGGGELGGLLELRDSLLGGYQQSLDDLATAIVDRVNTVHQGGFDLDGNAGGPLFEPLTPGAGAAGAIRLAAGVAGNPRALAASGDGAPGDGAVAAALARLREEAQAALGGVTFSETHAGLVGQLGRDTARADSGRESAEIFLDGLEFRREQVSGVDLDEEAADLLRYQRSYQASARFLQTVDEMIRTVLETF